MQLIELEENKVRIIEPGVFKLDFIWNPETECVELREFDNAIFRNPLFVTALEMTMKYFSEPKEEIDIPKTPSVPKSCNIPRPAAYRVSVEDGIPKKMGYRTGKSGLNLFQRKIILQKILFQQLPEEISASDKLFWGEPGSASRLSKLAETLAVYTRIAKRKDPFWYRHAIKDWENDLAWLKNRYYDGLYDFAFCWPETAV